MSDSPHPPATPHLSDGILHPVSPHLSDGILHPASPHLPDGILHSAHDPSDSLDLPLRAGTRDRSLQYSSVLPQYPNSEQQCDGSGHGELAEQLPSEFPKEGTPDGVKGILGTPVVGIELDSHGVAVAVSVPVGVALGLPDLPLTGGDMDRSLQYSSVLPQNPNSEQQCDGSAHGELAEQLPFEFPKEGTPDGVKGMAGGDMDRSLQYSSVLPQNPNSEQQCDGSAHGELAEQLQSRFPMEGTPGMPPDGVELGVLDSHDDAVVVSVVGDPLDVLDFPLAAGNKDRSLQNSSVLPQDLNSEQQCDESGHGELAEQLPSKVPGEGTSDAVEGIPVSHGSLEASSVGITAGTSEGTSGLPPGGIEHEEHDDLVVIPPLAGGNRDRSLQNSSELPQNPNSEQQCDGSGHGELAEHLPSNFVTPVVGIPLGTADGTADGVELASQGSAVAVSLPKNKGTPAAASRSRLRRLVRLTPFMATLARYGLLAVAGPLVPGLTAAAETTRRTNGKWSACAAGAAINAATPKMKSVVRNIREL